MRRIFERLVAIFNPQMRQVLNDHCYIALIDNPSKSLQIAAVRQSASAITLIDNPCEEAKYTAIVKNPLYMRFIKHPSDKLKNLVVAMNPDNIAYINNPSNELQMNAVKNKPSSVVGISNPSEKVQTYIVDIKPQNIGLISNPCEEAQIRAVSAEPEVVRLIKNPCIEAIRIVSKSKPEYLEGLVLDDYTMKIIGDTNPSALEYTKSAPISSLYDTLKSSPEKFKDITLSDNDLSSLYDLYMKINNIEYLRCSNKQQSQTDKEISDFCKNREIPEHLQSRIVKDRLSNIFHISTPKPSILSYALLRMTGNEITDRAVLNRISEPIKTLALKLETAIWEYSLQHPKDENLAYYANKYPDYSIPQIMEDRFETSIKEAYTKFQKATGLEFIPERYDAANKNFLIRKFGNVQENPNGYNNYLLYEKCSTAIKEICKSKETEIRNALDNAGLKDINLNREEINTLFNRGKITLNDGTEIKRIKKPKGYSLKAYKNNLASSQNTDILTT